MLVCFNLPNFRTGIVSNKLDILKYDSSHDRVYLVESEAITSSTPVGGIVLSLKALF